MLLLAEGLAERGHDCTLITFRAEPGDPRPAGVQVVDLARRRPWDVAGFALRLRAALRACKAEIVYSFLPAANVLSALLSAPVPVVWGMRASDLDLSRYGLRARLVSRAEAKLAHRAAAIVVNSEAGYRHALARGIPAGKMTVVRNGIDLDRFQRRPNGLRGQLGIGPKTIVIGAVARPDPMKDMDGFARALALLQAREPRAVALVAGVVPDSDKARLESLAGNVPIHWCGWRRDMEALYSACDLFCLSSAWGEGTSNALAEAMACGVPCVATAVGDNAILVGDTGLLVPPANPQALADALVQLAALDPAVRAKLSDKARGRIATLCARDTMVDRTIEVLRGRYPTCSSGLAGRA